MWLKWFPWRLMVRQAARRRGFIDPVQMMARFQNFAQPGDIVVPTELLRLGAALHGRGWMNSQAIQHNLDWVWPYWVECQFNPRNPAFVPRAFSLTHINLTHRNWTAVGVPGSRKYPLVDPRGLITPLFDRWSLDAWIIADDGKRLVPSRLPEVSQRLLFNDNLHVRTECRQEGLALTVQTEVIGHADAPWCQVRIAGEYDGRGWLVVSLRPYNPEGVSFINDITRVHNGRGWEANKGETVFFDQTPDRHVFSHYRQGDVYSRLEAQDERDRVHCPIGMATAAALFRMESNLPRTVMLQVPLFKGPEHPVFRLRRNLDDTSWQDSLEGHCRLQVPDKKFQFLYEAAVRTMILHAPDEVYPGPYTYRRFWFRDAAFILYAMLCTGFKDRAGKVIEHFFKRQTGDGYFLSQEGEWDSNGQAMWIMERFCAMTGREPDRRWMDAVRKGALWIIRKRLKKDMSAHAGLFPAGFSAEHLGPNDYYYWDDFWGIAGLRAAARLERAYGSADQAGRFDREAEDFKVCVEQSLERAARRLNGPVMPAAPYRRLDTGAVGSLAAGHPLDIFPARDPRLIATADYLHRNFLVHGGFFHDMTHSGINPYLTLHMAQVFLRAGDGRYFELMQAVADLASPTGQWPEAIHPVTLGGCMGDGQHVWAAAEWVLMVRNCFVYEVEAEGKLVLGAGIPPAWLAAGEEMSIGPAHTSYGAVELTIKPVQGACVVRWQGQWLGKEPVIEVRLSGYAPVRVREGQREIHLEKGLVHENK